MPTAEIKETIPASTDDVFALLHDYKKRLEWDTLLPEAYLEPEFERSEKGAISVCREQSPFAAAAENSLKCSSPNLLLI